MIRHDEGFFSAKDNLRLFWESDVPDSPKAHVAIVHGYGDHSGRYRQPIEFLAKEGFAAHAFDYRGHGQSDGRRAHCDHFGQYLEDVELFWDRVRKTAGGKKVFLLAHSHGGLIAVHWLMKKPAGLAGVVLSSPYLKLALKPPAMKIFEGRREDHPVAPGQHRHQARGSQPRPRAPAQRRQGSALQPLRHAALVPGGDGCAGASSHHGPADSHTRAGHLRK
jgi:alpha-beta hydrolase superfamily lysophospholipase